MGEQLKGEATAHLQDDGTFVLVPNNDYLTHTVASELLLKEWQSKNPPFLTTNTNLKEGEVVKLQDYEEVREHFDSYHKMWRKDIPVQFSDKSRTVLVLKEKKEQPIPNYNNLTVNEIIDVYNSWPLPDVLAKLVEATDHLLKVRNYDLTGWEEVSHCVERGREILAVLNTPKLSPLSEGREKEPPYDLRTMLIQAAQFGEDFGAANAWTLQYDSLEEMIDCCFEKEIKFHPTSNQ